MLQKKLHFYFMSPLDKWRIKRRFPLKALFQFLKIILVTTQIMYFGNEMASYLNYEDNTRTAFREMLLNGWDATREIFTYPPSSGTFAVYTSDTFYSSIDYAIIKYSNLTLQSVGTFAYDSDSNYHSTLTKPLKDQFPTVLFEMEAHQKRHIDPSKYIFNFNNQIITEYLKISNLYPAGDDRWQRFNSKEYFNMKNFSINFGTLLSLRIRFPLRTIYLNEESNLIRCYDLNVTIWYDNSDHDGKIPIQLTTERRVQQCKTTLNKQLPIGNQYYSTTNWPLVTNWLVIVLCSISIILCIRSLYRGQLLRIETDQFFYECFERRLTFSESMEFVDLWILMIAVNDLLIILGTTLKIRLESSDIISGAIYTNCSLMLGIGNLLVWIGMLRYLSYFKSYNILIITIRRSIPNILRGFCFCGWVVLGPYHLKFRTISSTSECLFSLMNGDDMFATFFSTDVISHNVIWWFSRIYFYLFISLAIYVIVSLFIAIILDSYESIRDYYSANEVIDLKSPLQKFIEEYPVDNVHG
ncbi:Mucolipin-2, partial [Blomia tropicalis]